MLIVTRSTDTPPKVLGAFCVSKIFVSKYHTLRRVRSKLGALVSSRDLTLRGADRTIESLRALDLRLRVTDRTDIGAFDADAVGDAVSYVEPSAEARHAVEKVRTACRAFVNAFDQRRDARSTRAKRIEHRRQRARYLVAELQTLIQDAPDSWIADVLGEDG